MSVLDRTVHLSEDLADFTGLNAFAIFKDVCVTLNSYVRDKQLAEGGLPLLGGLSEDRCRYPGPAIKMDDNLKYLFGPFLETVGVEESAETISYSQFKALILYQLRFR